MVSGGDLGLLTVNVISATASMHDLVVPIYNGEKRFQYLFLHWVSVLNLCIKCCSISILSVRSTVTDGYHDMYQCDSFTLSNNYRLLY